MRGKDIYHDFLWWQDGITPAYAGKSPFYRIDSYLLEDHPRLCGEKLFTQCQLRSSLGSPPPMRGKVHEMLFCKLLNRITPAYAGKSFSFSLSITCLLGSPPPMRGKAKAHIDKKVDSGITPAYAGKSIGSAPAIRALWDHPRLCGEKSEASSFSASLLGSPPPMRGKVKDFFGVHSPSGITPAYAGKRNQSAAK